MIQRVNVHQLLEGKVLHFQFNSIDFIGMTFYMCNHENHGVLLHMYYADGSLQYQFNINT